MSTPAVIASEAESQVTLAPSIGLMPALTIHQAADRFNALIEFTRQIMVKDQDYGTIEGVSKPCLYKAGAEKLCTLFGLAPSFQLIERVEDWTGRDHNQEPFFFYFYKCLLMRGGEIMGEGDGSCNSWEKKYRYRGGKRKCPQCGAEAIIFGKPEYERDERFKGGFICFGKKGGCGARFIPNDPAIVSQDIRIVVNPDVAESVNTIQKMAQKRALIAAVLITCNASAFYTQDMEDIKIIDVEYEPTQDEVAQKRIAEEKAKKAKARRDDDPLSGMPPKRAEPVARPEILEHVAALDRPVEPAAATKAKPLSDPDAERFAWLAKFKDVKAAIVKETGDDKLYYAVLKQAGYKKSNEIPVEGADTVLKMLRAGYTAYRVRQANLGEVADLRAKLGEQEFCDLCYECEVIAAQVRVTPDEKLLKLLELLRKKANVG